MSDSPSERENLTAALVRDYDDEQLVEWIHALQDREEELEAEAERLTLDLANAREDWRTAYARLEEQDARVAELEAIRGVFVRDNRDKTNAVRELQAALAGVLRSYEAYEMLCDPFPRDEYNAVMIPAWRLAASLVPGFDVRAMTPWVEAAALAAEKGETT